MFRYYAVAGIGLTLVLGGLLAWFLLSGDKREAPQEPTHTEEPAMATSSVSALGTSVAGREIPLHSFGNGEHNVLFVGGIHGGYEWNSILLAYEMIDYLHSNPQTIPDNITIDIIPNANPDGLYTATGLEGRFSADDINDLSMHQSGEGRFNANDVDLNRNFACNWAPESSWRGEVVSAGDEPFSEPEAQAIQKYVSETSPIAGIFWHSQANNVYGSFCNGDPLPLTLTLMNTYAQAGDYGAVPAFDAYPITGDVEGWLASIDIPAITVELETRTSTEWTRNLAGSQAVLNLLSEKIESGEI